MTVTTTTATMRSSLVLTLTSMTTASWFMLTSTYPTSTIGMSTTADLLPARCSRPRAASSSVRSHAVDHGSGRSFGKFRKVDRSPGDVAKVGEHVEIAGVGPPGRDLQGTQSFSGSATRSMFW
jgi:hypothetical protein